MTDYDVEFDRKFDQAIELEQRGKYKDAANIFSSLFNYGGERAWECLWHEGISLQRLHMFEESKKDLYRAHRLAPDELSRANVERDLAETLSELGEAGPARNMFRSALAVLGPDNYPLEHAATRGMLARHLLRVDEPEQAVIEGQAAVAVLERSNNPLQLLYALLNLADAKLLAGDAKGSQETAERARPLAKKATWKHRLRAWLLAKGLTTRRQLVKKYKPSSS